MPEAQLFYIPIMISTKRTDSNNKDFQQLVSALDMELKILDGAEHDFYAQFNKINLLKNAVVAYDGDEPVGCGVVKVFTADAMEVKRMYVLPNRRGQGIASIVLNELESWCRELNFKKCVLETGKRQPVAIALYKKHNYKIIPNFGPYQKDDNSVCFEKELAAK